MELRQFIEEQHTVMSEADFAGRGVCTAADKAGVADGVVWGAKRPRGDERLAGRDEAHDTVDACGFQRFVEREKESGGCAGQAEVSAVDFDGKPVAAVPPFVAHLLDEPAH